MPGVSRTDRLHALYEELRRRGPDGATGPELAERFGVSIRTITRDLATLQRTGAPIVAQRGPGGGYALDTSATLPPVSLAPAQGVAVAVALANRPQVLFADEPTGELDSATGDEVFAALRAANTHLGATVVVVTHDEGVHTQVQRTVAIRDGRTSSEVVRRTEVDEFGASSVVAEEYAVLDRAGRLQLPKEYRHALGLRDRVRLELEPDHVGVWPDGSPRGARPARRQDEETDR